MNKRNTLIAILVLLVLVMLLFAKGCVFRSSTFENVVIDSEEQAVCKKDFNPPMFIDSTTVENCNYPIVFHYQKPKQFGDAMALNHIIGLTMFALDSCPPMPDSTEAIHVYIRNRSNKFKYIYMGVYGKASLNENVEYRLTFPVKDSLGFRIVTDSGMVSSVVHWKSYGPTSRSKFKEEAEGKLTKQVEDNLVKEILKKMNRHEDSE